MIAVAQEPRAGHSHDRKCPACPGPHGSAGPCDHQGYGPKQRRFVDRHRNAILPLLRSSDSRAAAPELERIAVELKLTPDARGHSGLCEGECPSEDLNWRHPSPPCWECVKARRDYAHWLERQEPMEQGRGGRVTAPMPPSLLLDYEAGYLGRRRAA